MTPPSTVFGFYLAIAGSLGRKEKEKDARVSRKLLSRNCDVYGRKMLVRNCSRARTIASIRVGKHSITLLLFLIFFFGIKYNLSFSFGQFDFTAINYESKANVNISLIFHGM